MTRAEKLLLVAAVLFICWAVSIQIREQKLRDDFARTKTADQTKLVDYRQQAEQAAALARTQTVELENLRRNNQTPAQIVRTITRVVTLPVPPSLVTEKQADAANTADPAAPPIAANDMVLPSRDVKPLFDAQIVANECGIQLALAQSKLDLNSKTISVKDDEIHGLNLVVKGGTKWQRFKHDAKVVGVGIVIGGAAAAVAIKY